ncbi:unnamed protein product [Clavelina lepadiformis]|uniref:Nucleoside diphosphate kinase-like domain-containing protein n=3 Tax=Clavelina lepadiformis TaxID=159417 RepID=A0ABP0GTE3_CLALP
MEKEMEAYDSPNYETSQEESREHFANWNSIISSVKDNLPTLESESEVSSLTEDSDTENFIFQRHTPAIDSFPFLASSKNCIPQTEACVIDNKSSTNEASTSLLFQRLDCKAPQRDIPDDLNIHDLELPIYDGCDGKSRLYKDINGNNISLACHIPAGCKEPVLVKDSLPILIDPFSNEETSSTKETLETSFSQPSMLSLQILDKYDLDDVLESFQSDASCGGATVKGSLNSSSFVENEDTSSHLMNDLVSLSVSQSGGSIKSKPIEDKSKIDVKEKSKAMKTSSCGVTANLPVVQPSIPCGLSWSEPTTIYLDLRHTGQSQGTANPPPEKPNIVLDEKGMEKHHLPHARHTPFTHSKSNLQALKIDDVSDEESDEDDFKKWKMLRNKFKSLSVARHDAENLEKLRTATLNEEQQSHNTVSSQMAVESPICHNGFAANLPTDLKDYQDLLNSATLENKTTKNFLKKLTMQKVQSLKNKKKEINATNGHTSLSEQTVAELKSEGTKSQSSEESSTGIYARQRLKKLPAVMQNDDVTIPNSVYKRRSHGKTTVLFAEEPKTDTADVTNIYRDKYITSITEDNKVSKATAMSVQTDETFSVRKYDGKEYARGILSCSTKDLKAAAYKVAEEEKQKLGSSGGKTQGRIGTGNNRDTFSIVQNQRKQPPLTSATSLCIKPLNSVSIPSIPWEARAQLFNKIENVFKQNFKDKEANLFPLLYERDVSYSAELRAIPEIIDTQSFEKMVLLQFQMSSPGCIVMNRASGGHRLIPVDQPDCFSVTYSLLLSWLLALIPDNMNKPYDPPREDVFTIDVDTDQESDSTMKDGSRESLAGLVEIPFNVVSLHQVWQEETQTIAINAIVIPNFFYRPHANNRRDRRKKIKKENAFLHVVWQFLQSNRIQDVCPWYTRPESPVFYAFHETPFSCATKPLSTFITASNNSQLIHKALKRSPGFCWKMVKPDDLSSSFLHQTNNQLQTTVCLLQKETFTYPVCVVDLIIRLQQSCFDLASLRLVYVTRKFMEKNILSHTKSCDLEDMVPCIALAIRGKRAIKRMQDIIGPRDPVLAQMTDQGSLNAIYGEQLSKRRGDKDVPTEMNTFHCPRSSERVQQQLAVWFSGRFQPDDDIVVSLTSQVKKDVKVDTKVGKLTANGKCNGKIKTKNRNNCTSSDHNEKLSLDDIVTSKLMLDPFLVTCAPTQICLVVSPRFPPQFLGDVIAIASDQGFSLEGLKRLVLNEKKIAALSIRTRYAPSFKPPPLHDMTLEGEYYEIDNWWNRPATIMLLSRENAVSHIAGLCSCFQSDLIYQLIQSNEEGRLRDATCQCFHLCQYTDAVNHALGPMNKMPELELSSGVSPRAFYCDPEMEQVVVLTLLGYEVLNEAGFVLRTLFHGEFFVENDILAHTDVDAEHTEYHGFELLGLKFIPALSSQLAKELTPFEVGTRKWSESISVIKDSPALICALRRVNAYNVLHSVLDFPSNSKKDKYEVSLKVMGRLMSCTPEITYRQMKAFFTEKELFSDNRSRPMLKYIPPPNRVAQYLYESNDIEEGFVDSTVVTNQTPSKSSKKKKKNQNKEKMTQQTPVQSNESILDSMLSWPHPLTSILIIKPDAFPRHCVKILRRLHQERFQVIAARMTILCEDQASHIMPTKYEKMPGERRIFISHMTSSASLVLCVQRYNAVRRLLDVAGPANPWHAKSIEKGLDGKHRNWRAEFGIDEFSNAIHVSESYLAACEEQKLFFPEGLCCHETLELKMEQVPTPAEDPVMRIDKMKGREIKLGVDLGIDIYGGTGMEIQPVCVVMAPSLIQSKEDHNRKQSKQETCSSIIVPPYVDLLEQLITQGYQLCAMRMCWFRRDQAEKAYDLLGDKNNEKKIDVVEQLTQNPSLVLLIQRENGLLLFDSIIGSCLKHQRYLHLVNSFLRTQTTSQTYSAAKYLFHRAEHPSSVVQIVHKRALEWKECSDTN